MQANYDNAVTSAEGLVGGVYDTSLNQIDSFVAGEDIGFGEPVEYDVTNKVIKRITNSSTVLLGVAMRTNYAVPGSKYNDTIAGFTAVTSGVNYFPQGSQVSVMKLGRMFVKVTTVTQSGYGVNVFFVPAAFSNITGSGGAYTLQTSGTAPTNGVLIGVSIVDTATANKVLAVQVNATKYAQLDI